MKKKRFKRINLGELKVNSEVLKRFEMPNDEPIKYTDHTEQEMEIKENDPEKGGAYYRIQVNFLKMMDLIKKQKQEENDRQTKNKPL